jgi:hypothetical protein
LQELLFQHHLLLLLLWMLLASLLQPLTEALPAQVQCQQLVLLLLHQCLHLRLLQPHLLSQLLLLSQAVAARLSLC